jgi:predicted lipid-binding transport protein (Tim44 family)
MSQQRRKQRPQTQPVSKTRVPDAAAALAGAGNEVPDEHGYLAIGLATGGMAFVLFLTVMILMAAN